MEIEYVQQEPARTSQVVPQVIKTLSDGTEIIIYEWQGAEIAIIGMEQMLRK